LESIKGKNPRLGTGYKQRRNSLGVNDSTNASTKFKGSNVCSKFGSKVTNFDNFWTKLQNFRHRKDSINKRRMVFISQKETNLEKRQKVKRALKAMDPKRAEIMRKVLRSSILA
jgi:hypothetical protein